MLARNKQKQQGPKNIKLLFHGQGPEMIEKLGLLEGCAPVKNVIQIKDRIPDLVKKDLHVLWSKILQDEPGSHQGHQAKIKIIEGKDSQKSSAVELNKVLARRQRFLHVQQNTGDQKTRQNEKELNAGPPRRYKVTVISEDKQNRDRA